MNFYSANGVDQLISPHLPEFGYAVDVGANNGTAGSNSKHFEDRGWLVLCVEPNPMLEKEGRSCRKLWLQTALGSQDGGDCSFEIVGGYPYASFSGLHPREAPDALTPGAWKSAIQNTVTVLVPMHTLNTVLQFSGFPRLDLLTVDVEGHELEVLRGIDLNRWTPKIIVAEAWDEKSRIAITGHLEKFHYHLDAIREYDCCYGRR